MRTKSAKKPVVVAVSGGFDPLHIGHVRMFEEARRLGGELVVILNNDNWLNAKKGYAFMPEQERAEIIAAYSFVDRVVVTEHEAGGNYNDPLWRSVCRELEAVQPDIFANGGDRKPDGDPVPEVALCERLGIEMVYNVGRGGKVQSSSWLTAKIKEQDKKKEASTPSTPPATTHTQPHEALGLNPWILGLCSIVVIIGALDVLTRITNFFQS